jgi:hypothetical protein
MRYVAAAAALVFALRCLMGCAAPPAPHEASPLEAAVVIFRCSPDEQDDSVSCEPICGGVAISEREILTVAHCVEALPVMFADAYTWAHTTDSMLIASHARAAGPLTVLLSDTPLHAWASLGPASDGAAELVRAFEVLPAVIQDVRLRAPLQHGDSGGALQQGNRVVGLAATCDAADSKTCDAPRGSMIPAPSVKP